jgi:hypothetical protein
MVNVRPGTDPKIMPMIDPAITAAIASGSDTIDNALRKSFIGWVSRDRN